MEYYIIVNAKERQYFTLTEELRQLHIVEAGSYMKNSFIVKNILLSYTKPDVSWGSSLGVGGVFSEGNIWLGTPDIDKIYQACFELIFRWKGIYEI